MNAKCRFLLLQIRNPGDPIREQEVGCFADALQVDRQRVTPWDMLAAVPGRNQLSRHDVVLIGGSGDYSAASEGEWLDRILDSLRQLHDLSKPTFASCWGFQAMARAMGGSVIHDPARAELGTHPIRLTPAGLEDAVFSHQAPEFLAQMGHEDRVVDLPPDAILLGSTDRVENQAYVFQGRPIYCTQFHPELRLATLLARLQAYPRYVESIAGIPFDEFQHRCEDTLETTALLRQFVDHVLA